jgi:hypothetical protein
MAQEELDAMDENDHFSWGLSWSLNSGWYDSQNK